MTVVCVVGGRGAKAVRLLYGNWKCACVSQRVSGPRCSMASEITEKDKRLVRESWAIVEKDYSSTGLLLFRELFAAYPDYIKYFERMKSNPDQDIFQSARFRKHMVSALLPSVAHMLVNLDHPEELKAQLTDIGVRHKSRNLTRQHFEAIQKIILITLKKGLGENFTKDAESAWDKVLTVAFGTICLVLEGGN